MTPRPAPQPNTPTIILIGGTFTADTGENLDSRQRFVEDPDSYTAREALGSSELWWLVAASLTLPLLDAQGADSFAIAGAKTVVLARPDGTVKRRRLALMLPGGVRPSNPHGRWDLAYGVGLWRDHLASRVLVDTASMFWRNAFARDYAEFEQMWLKHDNLTIIGVHTHADERYLDGYVDWVADGRHRNAPGPAMPANDWGNPTRPRYPVVAIDGNFGVTAVVQNGQWVDPAALEAARALLQARFDLKLGIWDLVTNDVLRQTLLRETPPLTTPIAPAVKTVGALEREQALREQRTPRQKARDASLRAIADAVRSLDNLGWTTSLPGSAKRDIDLAHPFRRSLPLATAPECDDNEARKRHPALRPGQAILWLEAEIHKTGEHDTTVVLVVPPPLSSFHLEVFWPYFQSRKSELQAIVGANQVDRYSTHHNGDIISFDIAGYERTRPLGEADQWAPQRIAEIISLTTALVDFFDPLCRWCQEIIEGNPRLGCT